MVDQHKWRTNKNGGPILMYFAYGHLLLSTAIFGKYQRMDGYMHEDPSSRLQSYYLAINSDILKYCKDKSKLHRTCSRNVSHYATRPTSGKKCAKQRLCAESCKLVHLFAKFYHKKVNTRSGKISFSTCTWIPFLRAKPELIHLE